MPENANIDINVEFEHVLKWASDNKLTVNMAKTKEIVFHRPNPKNFVAPNEIQGIERVLFAKLLGVWLQPDLGTKKHCDYVLNICNQRLYLLTQMKKQGLPLTKLQNIFEAIIVSRILYGAPAWSGYVHSSDIECLQKMLLKAKRWQIVSNDYNVVDLFKECDATLFRAALNSGHSLNHLFPAKRQHIHGMALRPRGHNFSLPKLRYQCAKNSFINRSLFLYV